MALTNTTATLPGIIVPIFVGQLTHGNVCRTFNIHILCYAFFYFSIFGHYII